jgi:hypothetical protein
MEHGSELLVIVPSRGRPHNVARLVEGWAATASPGGRAHLLVAVDDDDPAKLEYLQAVMGVGFAWLEAGPRQGLGATLNRYATRHAPGYAAVGFMGDDHLPRTVGWDTLVLGALAKLGAGLVYGDDRLQGPALPTAVFMSSCVVDALGWLAPPPLQHLYLDSYWLALGRRLGRITYLPEVVIEHLHPVAGKAPSDEGYARVNRPEQYAADQAAWQAWAIEHLDADAHRVRANCLGGASA